MRGWSLLVAECVEHMHAISSPSAGPLTFARTHGMTLAIAMSATLCAAAHPAAAAAAAQLAAPPQAARPGAPPVKAGSQTFNTVITKLKEGKQIFSNTIIGPDLEVAKKACDGV